MKKLTSKFIITLSILSLTGILAACGSTTKKEGIGFEELELVCNVEEDVEYDYVTCLSDNTSKEVVIKAIFSNYITCPHPEKDGYELKQVNLRLTLDNLDKNAAAMNRCTAYADYYSLNSESLRPEGESDSTGGTEKVTVNGTEYELTYEFELVDLSYSEDGNTGYMDFLFEYEVPTGYDGVVIALYDHANTEKGKYLVDNYDENTLFFRLENNDDSNSLSPETVTEVTPRGVASTVVTEYLTYDTFEHEDRYIKVNVPLAEAFFYIPEGQTVTREDLESILVLDKYYNESHEYTYSDPAKFFTYYIMSGVIDINHLTEDYMYETLMECFNTMSYNEVKAYVDEYTAETSEEMVKKYACEFLVYITEMYVWVD